MIHKADERVRFSAQEGGPGSIWEFTQEQKGWTAPTPKPDAAPIRIGTAFYDHGRCLPWSMATECIVCEEWCPTSPKAVYLRPADVVDAEGNVKQVRQPYMDPGRCVGCGACEYACPVKDRPAGGRGGPVPGIGRSARTGPGTHAYARSKPRISGSTSMARRTRYVEAGVARTLAAGYRYQDRVDVTADIYVMKTAEGARKLFDSEPATGGRPLKLGEAGRTYGPSIVFRQGVSFVRLVALGECPPEALAALAEGIEKRLAPAQEPEGR